jgi:hypothetical protein
MGSKKWAPWRGNPINFKALSNDIERHHSQEIKEILLNKGIVGPSRARDALSCLAAGQWDDRFTPSRGVRY